MPPRKVSANQEVERLIAQFRRHERELVEAWEIQQGGITTTNATNASRTVMLKTIEFFAKSVRRYGNLSEDITTWLDLLDLDDFVSFGSAA